MSAGVDYVLPLRWDDDEGLRELTAYLRKLSRWAQVLVVDGSPAPLFARHAELWTGTVVHLRPDPAHACANGKVAGVRTGMEHTLHEQVVIADDDVRYEEADLRRVIGLLEHADLVRPQNFFRPTPWHAAWDTARSLLNRAVAGADYPGTFAIRRSRWQAMGGYDGEVLFENLELIRTVRASGGREARPLDLYVARLPCSVQRFADQRMRQAYDDLAQPWRLAGFLAVWPTVIILVGRRRPGPLAALVAGSVAVAEAGRRRAGGVRVFPFTASLLAPAWLLERGACSWAVLWLRWARGGAPYAGRRLPVAANSPRTLRARERARSAVRSGPTGGTEPYPAVAAVAEGLAGRATATAESDGVPAGVDLLTTGVKQPETAAHDQRAVAVGRDGHDVVDRPTNPVDPLDPVAVLDRLHEPIGSPGGDGEPPQHAGDATGEVTG